MQKILIIFLFLFIIIAILFIFCSLILSSKADNSYKNQIKKEE